MNIMAERKFLLNYAIPWTRRQLMTATASVGFTPIPCKKGKPRKLDKEVHPRKQMIAEQLKSAVENPYFLFFHYGDLSNSEWNDLRFELGKQNIAISVFPNKISSKVLEGTKYHNFRYLFKSTTATCYSSECNIKALLDVMKAFPKLLLLGGKVENEILSRNQVIQHSKLPTIEVMRGQLSQLLMQSGGQLSSTLSQCQRELIVNLDQYVSQNQEEPEP